MGGAATRIGNVLAIPESRGQGTAGVSGVPEEELGNPHELWTTRLLAHHAREHGPVGGMRASATWRRARRRHEKIPALAALGRLGEHADLANSVSEEAREMASLIEDLVVAGDTAKCPSEDFLIL
jgi:hypothetical protein